jgi:hypothetical protein
VLRHENAVLRRNAGRVCDAGPRSPDPAAPLTISGLLYGVAATSALNAWAVGDTRNGPGHKTLILRWNCRSWKQVPGPAPHAASSTA